MTSSGSALPDDTEPAQAAVWAEAAQAALWDRRRFVAAGALLGLGSVASAAQTDRIRLPFDNGERSLVRLPGKRPLIQLTARPPQLETPLEALGENALTPNDAFFVRYHLSDLPLDVDPVRYRLAVGGSVITPLSLSLAELRRDFEPVHLVAVNQCSGNGRGFSEPRVGGGQLGNGAVGNARWTGVRLSDVLRRAGVRGGAVEVAFNGLDNPPAPGVPDFVKSLSFDHANDGEVMLAWAMNGESLPFLNGFPLRLVVPGYYGTYWVKHLSDITVLDRPYDGYWMKTAYRVPDTPCACVAPGAKPASTRPISRLNVRSLITNVADGAHVRAGTIDLTGIALDGGAGIARVEVSAGGGWREATLGPDLGRYSFRTWRAALPLATGTHALRARAFAKGGETQPLEPLWNPAGYMRNVVETVRVTAA